MNISIIVARSINHVIGRHNQLMWHLPEDLKYFKRRTSGHIIIMGRKTYESIGRALPNRTNIVITRNKEFQPENVIVFNELEAAIRYAIKEKETETFIIGGGSIYKQALGIANKLYLTEVLEEFEGDTFFTDIDMSKWQLVKEKLYLADSMHKYPFWVREYNKITLTT